MIIYDYPLSLLKFRVSGMFSETTWRTMNCRQATHAFFQFLCTSTMNHLADDELPPGDACQFGTVIVFLFVIQGCSAKKKVVLGIVYNVTIS